jgi:hypothetical protein
MNMRHQPSTLFLVALALVTTIFPIGYAQSKPEAGDLPERREIHRSYRLAPGANVEVSMIAGPVEIETTNDYAAEVNVVESGQTRTDLECYKTLVEPTPTSLVIRHEQWCDNVRDYQRVKLILPRSVNVSLKNIAGFVRVGPIDGRLRLNSIAGEATVAQVQTAQISSLAQGLTIGLAQPSDEGIDISSVRGGVDLSVSRGVNTNLVISSLIGQITNEASNTSVTDTHGSYRVVIGSGGKSNSLSSIIGEIKIHH